MHGPTRRTGDALMTAFPSLSAAATDRCERLRLNIAGIGFDLRWEGARLEDEPALRLYQEFLSTAQHRPGVIQSDVHLRLHCGALPEVEPDALLFDATPNRWRLYRVDGRYLFEFLYTMPPHPRVQLAEMASDFGSGVIRR